ncbi:MAG: hypothetical protein V3V08_23465 [Nannocystaceae bacterium]
MSTDILKLLKISEANETVLNGHERKMAIDEIEALRQRVSDAEWGLEEEVSLYQGAGGWHCSWYVDEDYHGTVTETPKATRWDALRSARIAAKRITDTQ